jgi:hypothetical protein
MKYAVKMASVAMICMLSFTKMGCGIQKLMGRGDSQKQGGDLTSQLQESRLQMDLKELDSSGSVQSPETASC